MYKNLAATAVACLSALHESPRNFQQCASAPRALP